MDSRSAASIDKLQVWWATSGLARVSWNWPILWIIGASLGLISSAAALALVEIYSKRSSLGCPFPVFALAWYVAGLLPAAVHTIGIKSRTAIRRNRLRSVSTNFESDQVAAKAMSAVQGNEEWWIVQLLWAVYYIAGTLVYTSIMAVSVIELFAWVVISAALTASSKLLAFFICLAFEKKTKDVSAYAQVPLRAPPLAEH